MLENESFKLTAEKKLRVLRLNTLCMQEQKSFFGGGNVATGHVVKPMVHIPKGSHMTFLEDDEVQMRIAVRIHSILNLKGDNQQSKKGVSSHVGRECSDSLSTFFLGLYSCC